MNQEYFSVALSSDISLAVPLDSMGTVIQIETKNISVIPGIAEFWYGAINFKGSLLWVLDSDRYFNLPDIKNSIQKKVTAVIVKQYQGETWVKTALIISKLEGITSLSSEVLKPLSEDEKTPFKDCCSAVVQHETKRIFILNPTSFLQQLNQQSKLVST